ncbi:MAG: shikimate kinase [bacterium]
MASGKTAVGKALAKKLRQRLVCTDNLIVKRAKISIPSIFARYGEARFRSYETNALISLKKKKNIVVATGGGIIVKPGNKRLLKKLGQVVLLKVAPTTVLKRVKHIGHRPLLNIKKDNERLKEIKRLMKARRTKYLRAADISIDTDKLNVRQVVNKICQKLGLI